MQNEENINNSKSFNDSGQLTCKFVMKRKKFQKNTRRRNDSSSENGESFTWKFSFVAILICGINRFSEEGASEPSVVRPTKITKRINPNVQSTSGIENKRKLQITEDNSSESDKEETVLHSFKSNKSAQASGSSDQMATATLVRNNEIYLCVVTIFSLQLKRNFTYFGWNWWIFLFTVTKYRIIFNCRKSKQKQTKMLKLFLKEGLK